MHEFDLLGPLPTGTTLLEASAGTGKTFTIAALTARYLAQSELDVSQLLLITFGNHAAGELRSRVFERLRTTLGDLDARASGRPLPAGPTDPVADLLAADNLDRSRERLAEAVRRFNEATILTTHAFCQSMLEELGVLADWDPEERVGPDDSALARQCASDTYIRMFRTDAEPPITPRDALAIGRAACETPLPLLPESGPHHDFAASVRALYAQRKQVEGLCTFDDVTLRLRDALADGDTAALVRARLRERFPVVLVDEFQDTDPDQWHIIEAAFVRADRPTVLIGDPKQSIYGFRGADLGSYLAAKQHAEVFTLATNYRSDQAAVSGVVELFAGAELGSAEVQVTPLSAQHGARLELPGSARVWLRTAAAEQLTVSPEVAIQRDVIRQVRALRDRAGVRLSDIAVLVRTGARARALRGALADAGLPAVLTGSQSVWRQPAAEHWMSLLKAMAEPSQASIRLAALTPLIGSELDDLLAAQSPEPARVSTLVRELSHAFDDAGVGAVLTVLRAQERLDERLLSEADGERLLADIGHVAELLDADGARSLPALIATFSARAARDDEEDSIRVASCGEAIRVMTMHAAKGLEFPVVLLPETAGTRAQRWQPFTIIEDSRRHLYIGPPPGWRDELAKDLDRQNLAEELRLLYVGFTRAKHLCVAWHVADRGNDPRSRPLAHLLDKRGWRVSDGRARHLVSPTGLVSDSTLDETDPGPSPAGSDTARPAPLGHRVLGRPVDQTWRRTSYSGLIAGLHEPAFQALADEVADLQVPVAPAVDPGLAAASPMAGLPAGAGFGTLVHAVFERLDWAPARLSANAEALVAELGPGHGLSAADGAQLAAAIVAACQTPLLPVSELPLSALPCSDRLPELDFDLPLADRGAPATLAELADLMTAHLPADDPLAGYPDHLRSSEAASSLLNGFLTGSIDAVLRLPGGRFVVVDYKTNRLSPSADDVTLGHFTASAMAEAMIQAHYPLQAMLYCVALHRFLGSRLPGYDPEQHLGGVGYLFVRGMAGAQTPVVDGASCGVFGWFPPAALTVAASELLGGRRA